MVTNARFAQTPYTAVMLASVPCVLDDGASLEYYYAITSRVAHFAHDHPSPPIPPLPPPPPLHPIFIFYHIAMFLHVVQPDFNRANCERPDLAAIRGHK